MKPQNVTEIKIDRAKRKNGHKLDCICHICENIKNKAKRGGYEKEAEMEIEKIKGGSKKKNGHRTNCNCPICINMKNAKNKSRKIHKESENNEGLSNINDKKRKENMRKRRVRSKTRRKN